MSKCSRLMGFLFLAGLLMLGAAAVGLAAPPEQGPPPTGAGSISQLQQETGGRVRISHHAGTGKVRFIGADLEHPISRPVGVTAEATPEQAARQFLSTYGQLFGLRDPARELAVMRERTAGRGRSFVRFQQTHRGIPVLGGELIVQMDRDKNVVSANGEVLPDPGIDVAPTIGAETAQRRALEMVAKNYGLRADGLTTTGPELWVYNPVLLGGPGLRINTLVWRMDVTPVDLLPVRELVLVDAHRGVIALHFNQIDTAKNRRTYDANNGTSLPGALVCDESNPNCTGGDSHEVAAHVYAGDTYDFYAAEHGRDSIDDAGMTLVSTVHYDSGYANAFWNGSQMVYGDAYGFPLADDVVAHELTHGVTEHESHLFYYYQSGAINESFSDVWGELVDLYYATGNDSGDARWDIGEDVTGLGALRNMQNPTIHGDPDRVGSANYVCEQTEVSSGDGDMGGVHSNSGVNNKAAYLMTDGGSFNGYTVTGLGYAKVADLYYEVQTNLLTSASDYPDLYDVLIQACVNLGYGSLDCQEVKDAVDATEMSQQPASCPANEAPVCASGSPTYLFFDDMESGAGNWTHGADSGPDHWELPQNPNWLGWDQTYAASGDTNIWSIDIDETSDTYMAMSSDVSLPGSGAAYLHFSHAFGFESSTPAGTSRYDGGIVEYSTNGGSSWSDAISLFDYNGYNGALVSGGANPLAGRQAFSADSRGYISSRLDLSSLVGQNVRFRFRMGTDSSVWDYGWFIDDVRVYTCATQPDVSINKRVVGSGHQPGDPITFTLSIANNGTLTATGVVVTDIVPVEVKWPAYDSSLAVTPVGGTTYAWNVQDLAEGQSGVITVSGAISPGLPPDFSFTNEAEITANDDSDTGNNSSSIFVGTTSIYLPVIMKCYPMAAPTLSAIGNPDGDGNYTVSWSTSCGATSYTLEEDDNASFSSPTTVYSGASASYAVSGKGEGTYYYRVKACSVQGCSGWSNVQSVSVLPSKIYASSDTTIMQGYSTLNFCNTIDMWAGYDDYLSPDGKIVRSLIGFNVSSIPPGTPISQVKLYVKLYGYWDFPNRSRTITTYRVGSSWSSCSATWNNQPAIAEAYGSQSVGQNLGSWYSFDVTNLVGGWVNGSFSNYGVWLRGPEASGSDSSWRAFYTLNSAYDPYLSITYSGLSGTQQSVRPEREEGATALPFGVIEKLGAPPSGQDSVNPCQSDSSNDRKCVNVLP